jgi:hypothetical protein
MAFTGNKSDKEVIKTRKLYTGLANFTILAVNPTEKECNTLGITQRVGEYVSTNKQGLPQVRVDSWLKIKSIPLPHPELDRSALKDNFPLQKISFFITDDEIRSKETPGNKLWINLAGRTTWADSVEKVSGNPKMDWFNTKDLRPLLQGEETITRFLAAFMNVDMRADDVECRVEDFKKILKGNVKELRDLTNSWKDNAVQLLLGTKDEDRGTFQDFFKDFFGRPSVKDVSAWKRALKDKDNGLTAKRYLNFDIQDSLEFQEAKVSSNINATPGPAGGQQSFVPAAGVPYGAGADPDKPPF